MPSVSVMNVLAAQGAVTPGPRASPEDRNRAGWEGHRHMVSALNFTCSDPFPNSVEGLVQNLNQHQAFKSPTEQVYGLDMLLSGFWSNTAQEMF